MIYLYTLHIYIYTHVGFRCLISHHIDSIPYRTRRNALGVGDVHITISLKPAFSPLVLV